MVWLVLWLDLEVNISSPSFTQPQHTYFIDFIVCSRSKTLTWDDYSLSGKISMRPGVWRNQNLNALSFSHGFYCISLFLDLFTSPLEVALLACTLFKSFDQLAVEHDLLTCLLLFVLSIWSPSLLFLTIHSRHFYSISYRLFFFHPINYHLPSF